MRFSLLRKFKEEVTMPSRQRRLLFTSLQLLGGVLSDGLKHGEAHALFRVGRLDHRAVSQQRKQVHSLFLAHPADRLRRSHSPSASKYRKRVQKQTSGLRQQLVAPLQGRT